MLQQVCWFPVLFLSSHVGAYSFDLLRVCFLHLLIWCVLLSACPMFLPFLLLIHGILAVSLSHSHLPFLHEFILWIVLIVLFFFQFPHPHQRLRVVFVQQTGSKRFVSSVTALHCTCYHCSCLSVLVRSRGSRVQELCENRGGHPGLPVPKSPYSLCRT